MVSWDPFLFTLSKCEARPWQMSSRHGHSSVLALQPFAPSLLERKPTLRSFADLQCVGTRGGVTWVCLCVCDFPLHSLGLLHAGAGGHFGLMKPTNCSEQLLP